MQKSQADPRAQPVDSSEPAPGKRSHFWTYVACTCLVAGGLGTFALDWVIRLLETAPPPLPEQSSQSVTVSAADYDTSRLRFREGPSLKNPVGSPAPDFRLPDHADGHEVHLADFRGSKPVVLIFGSFSCGALISEFDAVKRLYQEQKDRANFLFVYIDETGHNTSPLEPGLALLPTGPEHRGERVQKGCKLLHVDMPTVLDTEAGTVKNAYDAWPRRLVVVDREGRIAVDLGRGMAAMGIGAGWDLTAVAAWLRSHAP